MGLEQKFSDKVRRTPLTLDQLAGRIREEISDIDEDLAGEMDEDDYTYNHGYKAALIAVLDLMDVGK